MAQTPRLFACFSLNRVRGSGLVFRVSCFVFRVSGFRFRVPRCRGQGGRRGTAASMLSRCATPIRMSPPPLPEGFRGAGGSQPCGGIGANFRERGETRDPGATAAPVHPRPFVPSIKSQFFKILITFGDKCPRNGSKNEQTAPRTSMG